MKKINLLAGALMIFLLMTMSGCGGVSKTTDEKFMDDLKSGLEDRWDLGDDASSSSLVEAEINKISQYEDAEFEDEKLGKLAKKYIEALETQEEALEYEETNVAKYNELWYEGYYARLGYIIQFEKDFGLDMGDEYAEDMKDIKTAYKKYTSGPEVTVEDIQIKGNGEYKYARIKIKNQTGSKIDYVEINFNILDKDGTVLENDDIYYENLEKGQTVWTETYPEYLSDGCSIQAVSYQLGFYDSEGIVNAEASVNYKEPYTKNY